MKKLWWKTRYTYYMCRCLSYDWEDIKFAWYCAGVSWTSVMQDSDDPGCPIDAVKEEITYWY